jgi:hypothetical protein
MIACQTHYHPPRATGRGRARATIAGGAAQHHRFGLETGDRRVIALTASFVACPFLALIIMPWLLEANDPGGGGLVRHYCSSW